jgi:hypothetical protein
MITATLSAKAEQLLNSWSIMDMVRLDANNADHFEPAYVAAHMTPVIDGPLFTCDQCAGQGFVPIAWDDRGSHPCYACAASGKSTFPAYLARVWDDLENNYNDVAVTPVDYAGYAVGSIVLGY